MIDCIENKNPHKLKIGISKTESLFVKTYLKIYSLQKKIDSLKDKKKNIDLPH